MQESTMTMMSDAPDAIAALLPILSFAGLAMSLLIIASMWKVFTKAGRPGWAALIPIYNTVVMLEIAGKPAWWLLLFFIPVVNLIVSVVLFFSLAAAFNKSSLFGLGLMLLGIVFFPLLAFGDAEYQGESPARA